ncbi:MAG: thioredoxin family protein [Acidobacteria bacterium]|nr:thioredoxin family protein [Acidobacteriota bacterium]
MMVFRKWALLHLAFAGILCFVGAADAQNPVSLSMSAKPAKAKVGDKITAQISASISGDWHMYSITQGAGGPIPTRITVAGGGAFKAAGGATGSAPRREMDPNFGIMTEFYAGSARFTVPVAVDASAQPGPQTLTVNVRYQVCNETLCLPPRTLKVSAPVEIVASSDALVIASPTPVPGPTASPSPSPTISPSPTPTIDPNSNANSIAGPSDGPPPQVADTNASDLKANDPPVTGNDVGKEALWSFLWLAVATGAISLLTPCVFPMIPITVSYFTNHAAGRRSLAIRDALLYALGIIFTFTAIGVTLAVVFGAAGINNFASSPYVNFAIAAIFIAFALSLFGAYELGIPSGVMTKVDAFARGKESSRILGVLLMGFVFSLTSFTCTAPFVGSLLVLAAAGDWLYPVVGMLAFSSVFALPFFVLALAPQLVAQLPRSGGWLNSIKVVMGFLEIAAAMKFISNVDLVLHWGIFTREVVLASWVAVAGLITLYLLGIFQLSHDSKPERLGAVRVMCSFLFLSLGFYLLTGLFGAKLGELESFLPYTAEQSTAPAGTAKAAEAEWMKDDYEGALAKAKSEGKSVFIDFTGYTCTNCRWMEANMFPKAEVLKEMDRFVKVQLFTDGEGEIYEQQQKFQEEKFGTVALPLYAIVDAAGNTRATFPGLTRDKEEFLKFLRSAD